MEKLLYGLSFLCYSDNAKIEKNGELLSNGDGYFKIDLLR